MPATNTINVLIVEDNPDDVVLTRQAFHQVNGSTFTVESAGTLKEAENLLNSREFDVVLLDLCLPDSLGQNLDTLMRARHLTQSPIIILTGIDDGEMAAECIKNGASTFLVKGKMSPKKLLSAVQVALDSKFQAMNADKVRSDLMKLDAVNAKLQELSSAT